MILLYGIPSERPLALVIDELVRRRAAHTIVSQRTLADVRCELQVVGGQLSGELVVGDGTINIANISAIYARPMDYRVVPEYCRARVDVVRDTIRVADESLRLMLNNLDALVVNRPRLMIANGSKPFQSQLIRMHGFEIPKTLITNDVDAVAQFRANVGQIVYKSISGQRSIVRRMTCDDLLRLAAIRFGPVQFQEYVDGIDVRVHVIGKSSFACAIFHDGTDYRDTANSNSRSIEAVVLPDELHVRCVEMCQSMGLPFGGIDLRIANDGRVFCFEVNPSPGYSYYQAKTGQPIAAAVATYLCQ